MLVIPLQELLATHSGEVLIAGLDLSTDDDVCHSLGGEPLVMNRSYRELETVLGTKPVLHIFSRVSMEGRGENKGCI